MTADAVLSFLLFAVRIGLSATALLAIGLSLHAALRIVEQQGRSATLKLAAVATGLLLLFAFARLVIVNAQLGGGVSTALYADTFDWTWTALGPATLAVAFGSGAILAAALLKQTMLAAAGALALAAAFGLTGHTSALDQPGLAPLAVALHVLSAGFWASAPVSLYPRSTRTNTDLHHRLTHFSTYASLGVPLLFILGLWLAWRLADGWDGLIGTPYGWLLLGKLAAALGALGLGALNQRFLTRLVAAAPDRGRYWLSAALTLEGALFAIAVVAVSAASWVGPVET